MAIDEALMVRAGDPAFGGSLRFYQWAKPTLSLGYFQRYADRHQHAASETCAIVRRATGGGAILHDHELTYSFTSVAPDCGKKEVRALYEAFHETLVDQLASFGITANLCRTEDGRSAAQQPFLCFRRRSIGDVLIGNHKVGGSAQRRNRGSILQHGSIILKTSSAAPELPGIAELSGVQLDPQELAVAWSQRLAVRLKKTFEIAELSAVEHRLVDQIERERFRTPIWTRRR